MKLMVGISLLLLVISASPVIWAALHAWPAAVVAVMLLALAGAVRLLARF